MPTFASYRNFAASAFCAGPFALVIGNFDGVHRGHRALLDEARRLIGPNGLVVVLTFWPHPTAILSRSHAPRLLLHSTRKRELFFEAGAQVVVEQRFDAHFSQLEAEEFVSQILLSGPPPRVVVVGHDFRFGRGRVGDAELLRACLSPLGTSVCQLSAVSMDLAHGKRVACSSTLVRQSLAEGNIEQAALLLGRLPELEGRVVRGQGRGRTISVPTANLEVYSDVVFRPGVYAAWAELLSEATSANLSANQSANQSVRPVQAKHPAAVNIGYNPTFQSQDSGSGSPLVVEAHLLLSDEMRPNHLYGTELRLVFLTRLRDEQRFSQVADLVAQIQRDIATVKQLTGGTSLHITGGRSARSEDGVAMENTKDRNTSGFPPTRTDERTSSTSVSRLPQNETGHIASLSHPESTERTRHEPALPAIYGRDEVEVFSKDPQTYFIYWEVTEQGLSQARAQLGLSEDEGKLVLRVFVSTQGSSSHAREQREIRDTLLHQHHGKKYLESPKSGAYVRAAVGLLSTEGLFAPVAQSQALRLPPQHPAVEASVEWAHVHPSMGDGKQREHIVMSRSEHQERELPWRSGKAPSHSALPVQGTHWIVEEPSSGSSGGASSSHVFSKRDKAESSGGV